MYKECVPNNLFGNSIQKKKAIYYPDSLVIMAGNALNNLPEPISWSWSVLNVSDWLQYGLKLPQYVRVFTENNIDGRKLILLNCRTLPALYITDFNDIKYIAKNVRHLYGLPPDTNWSKRRRCVRDVYSQYYTYLTTKWKETFGKVAAVTLFDYMRLIGMVSGPKDRVLMARLPATEYLRGGQCIHECTAELHILQRDCTIRLQNVMYDLQGMIKPQTVTKPQRQKKAGMSLQNITKMMFVAANKAAAHNKPATYNRPAMYNKPVTYNRPTTVTSETKKVMVTSAKMKQATTNT